MVCKIFADDSTTFSTLFRLNFTHLNKHNFRHDFRDTIDLICTCGKEADYPVRAIYSFGRTELPNDICAINLSKRNYPEDKFFSTYLCGSEHFNNDTNIKLLKSSMKYLVRWGRLNSPFFRFFDVLFF